MLIEILTKLFGGIWKLRTCYNATQMRGIKKIMIFIYTKALQNKGSWISTNTDFESIPLFPHGIYGIFISGGVRIGSNCIIFQHVTIGSNTLIDSKGFGAPIIGSDCYIGAGAKIIGNVTIGNNVRIGANAVVCADVPDNSIVRIAQQRVITRAQPLNNRFYHKYNGKWCYYDKNISQNVTSEELNILNSKFPK